MPEKRSEEPSYWLLTKEPRYALVMVLPMLVVYQAGVVLLAGRGAEEMARNAAEVFVLQVMGAFGLGSHLASGAVVLAVLVGWQLVFGQGWRVRLGYLGGMVLESLFYALVLLLSYHAVIFLERVLLSAGPSARQLAQQLVLDVGAGVYEEFLFRLVLIGCLVSLLRWAGAGRLSSALVASVVAAVAFSLFHMMGEGREALAPFIFIFRTFAGVVFAGFFFLRGFGITAGTHAFFNVILSLLPHLLALVSSS